MLYHPTLDKLRMLKFSGMSYALEEQIQCADIAQLSFEKRLGLLIDQEITERDNRRLTSRLRQARLKQQACMKDIYYQTGRGLDVRLTQHTIELFQRGKRVVSHVRSRHKGGFTTLNQHMPEAHKKYSAWSPKRFRQWTEKIGAATTQVIATILTSRRHPAACERALSLGTCRYKSIESILKNHLDSQPSQQSTMQNLPQHHDNIRGPGYYH